MTIRIRLPLPSPTEAEARARFPGPITEKSLRAMARLRLTPRYCTVPTHLVRRLWQLTGGWNGELVGLQPASYVYEVDEAACERGELRVVPVGDLRLVLAGYVDSYSKRFEGSAYLVYRGIVWHASGRYDQKTWARREQVTYLFHSYSRVLSFVEAEQLGLPVQHPA